VRRRDKILIAVGVVLTLLVAARIALPYGLERAIDRGLMAMEGYQGSVGDVDLALWNGAYHIENIQIVRTGTDPPRPFFDCDRVDLEIEWRSLMKGSLVAEGELLQPKLNLVQAESKEESQLGTETDWPTYLADLYPFDVNTVRVIDGTVTFRAPGIRAQDALTANGVNAVVSNLTNVNDSAAETFASFDVKAQVLAEAPVRIRGSVDPLAKKPTFDVNMSLEGVELPDVNPWLRQYLKADAQAGTFQLYLELAAADGAFEGYAKPLMQDVNMYGTQDKEENLARKVWEGLVEFAANIVENPEEKQVGARIPFSGTIDEPQANIWQTIVSVLRNAFVGAFARSLEGSISLRDVKKNLSELGESSGIRSPEDKNDDEKKDEPT
jgi:hypothetical protein